MELCVVRNKVKTNHVEEHLGNYDTEDSRTEKKCLCFEVCALCLSSTMESSRLYMWQNLVECRWYPMASSARICHLCTARLASSNDQLSKLFTHYLFSTLIKTIWFWMRWTIGIKGTSTSCIYDSKLTCYNVVFIHNFVAKSHACNARVPY